MLIRELNLCKEAREFAHFLTRSRVSTYFSLQLRVGTFFNSQLSCQTFLSHVTDKLKSKLTLKQINKKIFYQRISQDKYGTLHYLLKILTIPTARVPSSRNSSPPPNPHKRPPPSLFTQLAKKIRVNSNGDDRKTKIIAGRSWARCT